MKFRRSALVVFAVLAGASSKLSAQDDGGNGFGGCGIRSWCDSENFAHTIINGPVGPYAGLHGNCKYCDHPEMGFCHADCYVSMRPDSVRANRIYAEILTAARQGNIKSIAALAQALPGFVEFNASRNSVQILSCSRVAVIGNIPLTSPQQLALVSSLPRTATESTAALTLDLQGW